MMKKLVNSLVSIAHSLNTLVEIQSELLAIGKENIEWTRKTVKDIRDNG